MNGKYVMFYALIVAAMVVLLIVSIFDWRLLNCEQPLKPDIQRKTSPQAPPEHERVSHRYPNNKRSVTGAHTSQHTDSEHVNFGLSPHSGYFILEDEYGNRELLHRDGRMAEDTELRNRASAETNLQQASSAP